MGSFYVGTAGHTATGLAVHERSGCPAACLADGTAEYLGEYTDPTQALAVARLRYGAICACDRAAAAAWPWPAPVRPLGRTLFQSAAAALNSDRVSRSSRGPTGFSSTGSPDSASWSSTFSSDSPVTITTPMAG